LRHVIPVDKEVTHGRNHLGSDRPGRTRRHRSHRTSDAGKVVGYPPSGRSYDVAGRSSYTGLREVASSYCTAGIGAIRPLVPPGNPRVRYYKAVVGERVIGGLILFDAGKGVGELGRIFVDPDFQDRGHSQAIVRAMYKLHPDVERWQLGTPEWATRNGISTKRWGSRKPPSSRPTNGCPGGASRTRTACRRKRGRGSRRAMECARSRFAITISPACARGANRGGPRNGGPVGHASGCTDTGPYGATDTLFLERLSRSMPQGGSRS